MGGVVGAIVGFSEAEGLAVMEDIVGSIVGLAVVGYSTGLAVGVLVRLAVGVLVGLAVSDAKELVVMGDLVGAIVGAARIWSIDTKCSHCCNYHSRYHQS